MNIEARFKLLFCPRLQCYPAMNIIYEQSNTRTENTFEAPCITIANNYMNEVYK